MVQFTKVTSENYKKGFEDTHNRFRRYQIKPVCSDLQSQILKCYAENKGQTMSCSNIASLYIQCVDRARQNSR
ncbi:vegetative cell wall gp1-like protein [Labeo rohita]|uniref:Vegetative cell wall gp1-like protein n=1 Tax=Labeo rohita TaxID=84645 RepID=A0A498NSS2_LABRO|nr:vegetative cell wall gp1-like protein [Labeo rohita]RXN34828.1 vegetative cell wall gp1-like protein [Labeo rohita]